MGLEDKVKPANGATEMREEIQILHANLEIKEYNSVCKTMRDLSSINLTQRKRDQEYILTSVKKVEEIIGRELTRIRVRYLQ